jgi:hypothetical protein
MRVVKEDSCENELSKGDLLAMLWEKFGDKTVEVMTEGSKLLALLWESAWKEGGGRQGVYRPRGVRAERSERLLRQENEPHFVSPHAD